MAEQLLIFVLFVTSGCLMALPAKPVCSKFDYELRTLETMLRTEQKVEKMLEELQILKISVSKDLEEMKTLKITINQDFDQMNETYLEELKELKVTVYQDFDQLKNSVDRKVSDQNEKVNNAMEMIKNNSDEKARLDDHQLMEFENKKGLAVAFSVTRPTTSFVNEVPIFMTAITNIGDGYNMTTGVFTSPVDGLYMFSFTVASNGQQDVYCYIYHNDAYTGFARSYSDNSYTTASTSVYLLLSKDDIITLKGCGGWNHVYSGNLETMFSGALVKKTSKN